MTKSIGIERFVKAQKEGDYVTYNTALSEIQEGHKVSHWIWYIFPNIEGLGRSDMALFYAIKNLDEAKEFMSDEYLRHNLVEITEAVLNNIESDIVTIMGSHIDAAKLKSCMTLFAIASPEIGVFKDVLDKYFEGKPDYKTIELLGLPKSFKFFE